MALTVAIREHRTRTESEIQHHYLETLLAGNIQSERYTLELERIASPQTKRVAAELISSLTPILYRYDPEPIERIAHSLHLSEYLLHEASRHRGVRCARLLALAARVPFSGGSLKRLQPFLLSEDRQVRFYALLATINADSSNAMRHIADYPAPMTQFELLQLVAVLRQGAIVVAYQPMLHSSSENLQMLGLAVVRHFAIDSAAQELRDMIRESRSAEIRREALYTLASMQLTLSTPVVVQFVRGLPHIERERFLRYAACEGYSQEALEPFVSHYDRDRIYSLINSYKIRIGC